MKAFQQTLLGEGEAAAPHPTVLAERLSQPSPRKRGEGTLTIASALPTRERPQGSTHSRNDAAPPLPFLPSRARSQMIRPLIQAVTPSTAITIAKITNRTRPAWSQ